jgi:glycosyltransferase involved in cell wall biosynthesis
MYILVASTQWPYYGGGATSAYHTINYLRNKKYTVGGIFINPKGKANLDPDNIGNIKKVIKRTSETYVLDGLAKPRDTIRKKINMSFNKGSTNNPSLILCFNYESPIICKELYPNIPIYFIVTGIPEITLGNKSFTSNNHSALSFISMSKYINMKALQCYTAVEEACNACNKIVLFPNITEKIFQLIHNDFIDKCIVIDTLYPIYSKRYNMSFDIIDKEFDIICISSNWKRSVKNMIFCEKIFMKNSNLNKIIIGGFSNDSDDLKTFGCSHFKNIPNTKVLPLIDHDDVLKYIKKSKILLLPSFYESYSLIILEAMFNNCKVLTSRNVGSSNLISNIFICDDVYDEFEWNTKISLLLNSDFDTTKSIQIMYERLLYDIKTYSSKNKNDILYTLFE